MILPIDILRCGAFFYSAYAYSAGADAASMANFGTARALSLKSEMNRYRSVVRAILITGAAMVVDGGINTGNARFRLAGIPEVGFSGPSFEM